MIKRNTDTKTKKAYRILSMISIGPNATVFKAQCLPTGSKLVAIKSVNFAAENDAVPPNFIDRDSLLFHRNLLHVYRIFLAEDGCVWAVMPFFSGGSLRSILPYYFPDALSEPCIAEVLKQVLWALAYLHSLGMFHRDIKPGNIVIGPNTSVVKLADYGISESFYKPLCAGARPYWKAPEDEIGEKSDVWSFGVTALELAHGGPPLSPSLDLFSEALRFKIRKRFGWSLECEERYKNNNNDKDVAAGQKKTFSEDFAGMVASCLDQDPAKRPSAEDLLSHPFFNKNVDDPEQEIINLLDGVPGVEKRLNEFNLNMGDSVRENVEHVEAVSWEFNRDKLKLDPVYQTEPASQDSAALDWVLQSTIQTFESLDRRWQKATSAILAFGGRESSKLSREEKMAKTIEEMKDELEVTTRRTTELNAELDHLRDQLRRRRSSGNETK